MQTTLVRWFKRLRPRTAQVSRYMFLEWMRWMREHGGGFRGLDADGLVEWQQAHHGSYEILDLVQDFVREKQGRAGYKQRIYGCIRSFFMHNRAELPRDPSFRVQSEKPKVVGTLSLREFKRILAACNPMYRAIFLSMFQGGMGVNEFLYWNEHGLEQLLNNRKTNPLRIDLPGRKRRRNVKPFYTFIGRDAIHAVKTYLELRPGAGDHIFFTQFKQPVSYRSIYGYWMLKLRRLGLITPKGPSRGNRYGKNIHEIRDLFRSRWRPSGSDVEVAEYFMGHDLDRLGYDKSPKHYPDWFLEQYMQAEPWLNILSEEPEKVSRSQLLRIERGMKEEYDRRFEEQEKIIRRLEEAVQRLLERRV